MKEAIKWAEDRKKKVVYKSDESSLTFYVFKMNDGYIVCDSNEVARKKLTDWVYKTK